MTNAPSRLPPLPFALRIGAAQDAQHLAEGWATLVVSLLDPPRPGMAALALPALAARHLIQYFDDVEKPVPGLAPPSVAHLDAVLAVTRALTPCHAGISRSPAMAVAILVQHGLTAEEAVVSVAAL